MNAAVIDARHEACAAFAALGDAVALLDTRVHSLAWVSPAWLALQPTLPAGTPLPAIERAMPGLAAARIASPSAGRAAPARSARRSNGSCRWRPWSAGTRLLRLFDRREQSRARAAPARRPRAVALHLPRDLGRRDGGDPRARAEPAHRRHREPAARAAHAALGGRKPPVWGRTRSRRRSTGRSSRSCSPPRVIARIREFTHSHQPRHARVDLAVPWCAPALRCSTGTCAAPARVSRLDLPEDGTARCAATR